MAAKEQKSKAAKRAEIRKQDELRKAIKKRERENYADFDRRTNRRLFES